MHIPRSIDWKFLASRSAQEAGFEIVETSLPDNCLIARRVNRATYEYIIVKEDNANVPNYVWRGIVISKEQIALGHAYVDTALKCVYEEME